MDHKLTTKIDHAKLIKLYAEQELSVDKLPYTTEIDKIVSDYNHRCAHPITHLDCYRTLINLRKNSKLLTRVGSS